MPRTIRDAKLETRAARDRLRTGQTPHFKTLVPGKLHLGYRRKRKDLPGQWLVRHYLGAERYHIAPLGLADDFQDAVDDAEVLTFADAQRAALAHRQARKRPGKSKTIADAIAAYVAEVRMGRPATAADAERTAAKLILPALGRIRLADLTTDDIIDWRNALAKEPARLRTKPGEKQKFRAAPATKDAQRARRATVNRVLGVLKAALNAAVAPARKEGVPLDPIAWQSAAPFGNKSVAAARPGFLTVAECKRLINAADAASGFRNLVREALTTGCRYGELCTLEVRDFQRGKLHIRESKSGRPRNVALTPEGAAFFEQLTAGRAAGALMFQRADGSPWKKSMQSRPMREACKRAKIGPPVGFHQLRHSWASLAVMNEMPLMVVARNLGHANTAMVERHCAHLREDYVDKETRAAAPMFDFVEDEKIAVLPR
jgi:integrase